MFEHSLAWIVDRDPLAGNLHLRMIKRADKMRREMKKDSNDGELPGKQAWAICAQD